MARGTSCFVICAGDPNGRKGDELSRCLLDKRVEMVMAKKEIDATIGSTFGTELLRTFQCLYYEDAKAQASHTLLLLAVFVYATIRSTVRLTISPHSDVWFAGWVHKRMSIDTALIHVHATNDVSL